MLRVGVLSIGRYNVLQFRMWRKIKLVKEYQDRSFQLIYAKSIHKCERNIFLFKSGMLSERAVQKPVQLSNN